jgi:arylsulfatase A-like enzyme
MKNPSAVVFLTALLPLFSLHAAESAKPKTPPNIVVIMADDLGFGDLSCYGAKAVPTPNVDRIAANGLRFVNGYAPASTCTPSRYAMLTGDYAWRQTAKQTTILDGDAPLAIEPGSVTLPEMLRRAGYTTGIVGKWHLGLGDGKTPINFNSEVTPGPRQIGFDYSIIIPATVDRVPSVWLENDRVVGLDPSDPITVSYKNNISDTPLGSEHPELLAQQADPQHSNSIINGISRIGYMKGGHAARFKDADLPHTVVDKTVAFLEKNQTKPFFLYVGLFEPHVPRLADPRIVGSTGSCGIRGDVIRQMDWETGKILDAIDRLKLADNTLILFTSDNGPIFFDGYQDNAKADADAAGHKPAGGLRGFKYLVYEGSTRVPFIIRWPAQVAAGVSDRMICLTDMMATCAAVSSAEIPQGVARDSLNQLPVLLDHSLPAIRETVVQQGISGAYAIRQGDWKYIPANATKQANGMGSGANPDDPRFAAAIVREPLLFNLADDVQETKNLAAQYPEKVKELATLLRKTGVRTMADLTDD